MKVGFDNDVIVLVAGLGVGFFFGIIFLIFRGLLGNIVGIASSVNLGLTKGVCFKIKEVT